MSWKVHDVVKQFSKKLGVAVGGLALAMTAGAGVASADPMVDTTCSYPQVIAALNAEDPALAQKFASNPVAGAMLQSFLDSGPAERQQMVQEFQGTSWGQKYFDPMMSIANSCNNY